MNESTWACDHSAMMECCDGCGHFSCPCGILWDECAEGVGHDMTEDPNDPETWA